MLHVHMHSYVYVIYLHISCNSDICAKYKPCFPVWLITLQLLSRLRFVRSTLPIQRSLIGSKLWITHPIHGWTLSCLVQLSLSGVFSWDHQIMIYIYKYMSFYLINIYLWIYYIAYIYIVSWHKKLWYENLHDPKKPYVPTLGARP